MLAMNAVTAIFIAYLEAQTTATTSSVVGALVLVLTTISMILLRVVLLISWVHLNLSILLTRHLLLTSLHLVLWWMVKFAFSKLEIVAIESMLAQRFLSGVALPRLLIRLMILKILHVILELLAALTRHLRILSHLLLLLLHLCTSSLIVLEDAGIGSRRVDILTLWVGASVWLFDPSADGLAGVARWTRPIVVATLHAHIVVVVLGGTVVLRETILEWHSRLPILKTCLHVCFFI